MKFCVETLGCKVNQYETQALENILLLQGHTRAEAGSGCDACIINTCAVTNESARKSRQAVRRLKSLEPDAIIAVCGCLAQLEPEKTAKLGVKLVGGSGGRQEFANELIRLIGENNVKIITDNAADRRLFEELPSGGFSSRTRAMLKIQDGCDNYCAYCVIPYSRGRVRSLPLPRAEEAARKLGQEGYREIIITGIEISSYGKDLEKTKSGEAAHSLSRGLALAEAVCVIGKAAPLSRLRLGSLDPAAVTEEFCEELSKAERLCGHFHLSLQSGCDETLRRMRRRYDTQVVWEAIAALRRRFPGCAITADLITGFPGETDGEFDKTMMFIKKAAFSDMHIFPFSPRPGTAAADMPGQVDKSVRRERAAVAAACAAEMADTFRHGQRGKTAEVLFECERGGFWTGHTGNYIEVSVKEGGAKNSMHFVRITDIKDGRVWGEIIHHI